MNAKQNRSLPDLSKLRTFSFKNMSTQKNQEIHSSIEITTPIIKYFVHEPKDRKKVNKIFLENVKKRQIERQIQEYQNKAYLNGVAMKQSQIERFKLYLQTQQDSPSQYFKNNTPEKNSLIRSPPKTSGSNRTQFFVSKKTTLTPKPKPKSPTFRYFQKAKEVQELMGKTKLFTIVYRPIQ